MKARIALLYGGASEEHDVSVLGCEYMKELLRDTEYEILPVYINRNGEWTLCIKGSDTPAYPTRKNGGSLCTGYGFIKIDAAIPLLHGDGGEDGTITGALDVAGIPYVGAGVCASAVCLDKVYTKAVARSIGLSVLADVSFSGRTDADEALGISRKSLDFPLFIKPRRLGSSVGAYPARDEYEFKKFFPLASEIGGGLVMVEEMLSQKREIECAFVEYEGERIVTPPGEILIDGFYGYGEKYGGKTKTAPRAAVTKEISDEAQRLAQKLADAIDIRHLARIDFFLTDKGLYFNEINTFPGFTRESLYPAMLREYGIDPRDAILSFVKDALGC